MNAKTLLAVAAVLALFHAAQARVVTLYLNSNADGSKTNASETLTVREGEYATLKFIYDSSFFVRAPDSYGSVAVLEVVQETNVLRLASATFMPGHIGFTGPAVIAGPATMRLALQHEYRLLAAATIEVLPEPFPPDRTLIIPEGTGASIVLESSADLLSWSSEWSESYTNVPASKFFRIRAERFP